jgi:EAL domain-containing protein (putative c-di-GMP-specific phosphodiesterase class I)
MIAANRAHDRSIYVSDGADDLTSRSHLHDAPSLGVDIIGAAARGELAAYFQPQIELGSGRVVAAEALCRWTHPELGVVPPTTFIAFAEGSVAIHEIGAFMVDAGCRFQSEINQLGRFLDVSINVSPAQLLNSTVLDHLLLRVGELGLDPSRITIEITESLEILDVDVVVKQLTAVRDAGIGVSIDDFGAGHSSLEQVLLFPVSEVKIDRSLVQGSSEESRARFSEVMDLARSRSLCVVAEGVETEEQLAYVTELGCERAQGYLLGRAVPQSRFESLYLG